MTIKEKMKDRIPKGKVNKILLGIFVVYFIIVLATSFSILPAESYIPTIQPHQEKFHPEYFSEFYDNYVMNSVNTICPVLNGSYGYQIYSEIFDVQDANRYFEYLVTAHFIPECGVVVSFRYRDLSSTVGEFFSNIKQGIYQCPEIQFNPIFIDNGGFSPAVFGVTTPYTPSECVATFDEEYMKFVVMCGYYESSTKRGISSFAVQVDLLPDATPNHTPLNATLSPISITNFTNVPLVGYNWADSLVDDQVGLRDGRNARFYMIPESDGLLIFDHETGSAFGSGYSGESQKYRDFMTITHIPVPWGDSINSWNISANLYNGANLTSNNETIPVFPCCIHPKVVKDRAAPAPLSRRWSRATNDEPVTNGSSPPLMEWFFRYGNYLGVPELNGNSSRIDWRKLTRSNGDTMAEFPFASIPMENGETSDGETAPSNYFYRSTQASSEYAVKDPIIQLGTAWNKQEVINRYLEAHPEIDPNGDIWRLVIFDGPVLVDKDGFDIAVNDTRFVLETQNVGDTYNYLVTKWPISYALHITMTYPLDGDPQNQPDTEAYSGLFLLKELFQPPDRQLGVGGTTNVSNMWPIRTTGNLEAKQRYDSMVNEFMLAGTKHTTRGGGVDFPHHLPVGFASYSYTCEQALISSNIVLPCGENFGYGSPDCTHTVWEVPMNLQGELSRAPIAGLTAALWVILGATALLAFSRSISLSSFFSKLLKTDIKEEYVTISSVRKSVNATQIASLIIEAAQFISFAISPRIPLPSPIKFYSDYFSPVITFDIPWITVLFPDTQGAIYAFFGISGMVAAYVVVATCVAIWSFLKAAKEEAEKGPIGDTIPEPKKLSKIGSFIISTLPMLTTAFFIPILRNATTAATCTYIQYNVKDFNSELISFQITDLDIPDSPFCWIGETYWGLLLGGLAIFVIYLPLSIALQPIWQFLLPQTEIFYPPTFLSLLALSKLVLVLITAFFSSIPLVGSGTLFISSIILLIYTRKRRPCNIWVINNWRIAIFMASIWSCILSFISYALFSETTFSKYAGTNLDLALGYGYWAFILLTFLITFIYNTSSRFAPTTDSEGEELPRNPEEFPLYPLPLGESKTSRASILITLSVLRPHDLADQLSKGVGIKGEGEGEGSKASSQGEEVVYDDGSVGVVPGSGVQPPPDISTPDTMPAFVDGQEITSADLEMMAHQSTGPRDDPAPPPVVPQ